MADLAWVESNVVDELTGALSATASLCAHRPGKADAIRAEVLRQLDDESRALVGLLYGGTARDDRDRLCALLGDVAGALDLALHGEERETCERILARAKEVLGG